MFTRDNTTGFSADELELLNTALNVLLDRGFDEKNAADIVNNNWQPAGNTVESLVRWP